MRSYEVMVIIDPSTDDDGIQSINDRIAELIRSRGGTPERPELWGRRRLAYPIRHRYEGFYSLVRFSAEPAAIADLDRVLGIEDNVMRHKIVRLPDQAGATAAVPAAAGPSTAD